jgi:hypothetical protein
VEVVADMIDKLTREFKFEPKQKTPRSSSIPLLDFNIPCAHVLVTAGGIPSWTTFIREEEDSRSKRKTIEQLKNTLEENLAQRKKIKWK